MTSSPPIRLTGLVKQFAKLRAVDGLDLTVQRGEVVLSTDPDLGDGTVVAAEQTLTLGGRSLVLLRDLAG